MNRNQVCDLIYSIVDNNFINLIGGFFGVLGFTSGPFVLVFSESSFAGYVIINFVFVIIARLLLVKSFFKLQSYRNDLKQKNGNGSVFESINHIKLSGEPTVLQ